MQNPEGVCDGIAMVSAPAVEIHSDCCSALYRSGRRLCDIRSIDDLVLAGFFSAPDSGGVSHVQWSREPRSLPSQAPNPPTSFSWRCVGMDGDICVWGGDSCRFLHRETTSGNRCGNCNTVWWLVSGHRVCDAACFHERPDPVSDSRIRVSHERIAIHGGG